MQAGTCPAVLGDYALYYDREHFTASFSASLRPQLEKALEQTGLFTDR